MRLPEYDENEPVSQPKALDLVETLGASWRTFRRHATVLIPVGIVVSIAIQLIVGWLSERLAGPEELTRLEAIIQNSVWALLSTVVTTFVVSAVKADYASSARNPSGVATGALGRLLPVLGVSLTVGLLLFGPIAGAVAIGAVMTSRGNDAGPLAGMVFVISTGAFAIYALPGLAMAVQATVIEGLPIPSAIRRSRSLTMGHRIRVFAYVALTLILWNLVQWTAGFVGSVLALGSTGRLILIALVSGLALPLIKGIVAHLYYTLRVLQEGET